MSNTKEVRVRAGNHRSTDQAALAHVLPLPDVTLELLDTIIDHTVAENLRHVARMLADDDHAVCTNVDSGAAGIILELVHHRHNEPETGRIATLAVHMAVMLKEMDPPPGLIFGSTGTAIALIAAGRALCDDGLANAGQAAARREIASLARVECDDYTGGLAGVGIGHLILAQAGAGHEHLEVAAEAARRLLAGDCIRKADRMRPAQRGSADGLIGFAHGQAGIAYFLLALAHAVGDECAGEAARVSFEEVAVEVPRLVADMRLSTAPPMCASWCQGMAGIGSSLIYAGRMLRDDRYFALAREAAKGCLRVAPRMRNVSQCCGLAGVGEFLVDLALATGDPGFFVQAEHILALMLSRCCGDVATPIFPDHTYMPNSGYWGTGSAGVLSFLRRLQARRGARLLMADWPVPNGIEPTVLASAEQDAG